MVRTASSLGLVVLFCAASGCGGGTTDSRPVGADFECADCNGGGSDGSEARAREALSHCSAQTDPLTITASAEELRRLAVGAWLVCRVGDESSSSARESTFPTLGIELQSRGTWNMLSIGYSGNVGPHGIGGQWGVVTTKEGKHQINLTPNEGGSILIAMSFDRTASRMEVSEVESGVTTRFTPMR